MKRLMVSVAFAIACTPGVGQVVHTHRESTERPAKALPPPVIIAGVEALRAFREAARLDPNCAMCEWGIYRAMDFGGSAADQLKPVVTEMKELARGASDHEQGYIRSVVESFGKKGEEASQAGEWFRREGRPAASRITPRPITIGFTR
jgi:hypothetical protein